MFLLELLHSLLFEFGFVLLGQLVFGDYHLAVDWLTDFLGGAVAVEVVSGERENLVIRHNRHALTLDLVEYELATLLNTLGGVGISYGEQIVALCTAIKIVADSLDKVFG